MVNAHATRTRRFTADEVMKMVEVGILDDREPVELLDGELVYVSPIGPQHMSTSGRLARVLMQAFPDDDVRIAGPIAAGPASLPEPDLAVARGPARAYDHRHPRGDELRLVVEIARTSLGRDRLKTAIYAAAGVPVYWLIDVESRRVEVYSQPEGERYRAARVLAEGDPLALPDTVEAVRLVDLLPGALP